MGESQIILDSLLALLALLLILRFRQLGPM
jgi:hypothetical protein